MIQIDFNTKTQKAQLTGPEFDEIREHFSVPNPAVKYLKKIGRYAPQRLYAISSAGHLNPGLLYEIYKFADNRWEIQCSAAFRTVYSPTLSGTDVFKDFTLIMRDYQESAVSKCLQNGRGIVVLGTGAGKTLTIASLIESVRKTMQKELFKCLLIVPDLGLVSQTFSDFQQYAVPFSFSKWTGKYDLDFSCDVIIANSAVILARLEENEWIRFVDLVICDEAHRILHTSKITKVFQKMHTPHKFGFTGTLPVDLMSRWSVIGNIGPILYEKKSSELREEKYLSNVSIKALQVSYKDKPKKPIGDLPAAKYHAELDFIYSNPFRTSLISTICKNFTKNILVLVNHLEHGRNLLDVLTDRLKNKQTHFIQGSVEVEDRNAVKRLMEEQNDIVCIAMSSIFSTGINIKNLHMIIFGAGGKSFIRTVQSIGRGLRLHPLKEELLLIDIADNLKYGREHFFQRKQIYQQEAIRYTVQQIVEPLNK